MQLYLAICVLIILICGFIFFLGYKKAYRIGYKEGFKYGEWQFLIDLGAIEEKKRLDRQNSIKKAKHLRVLK